MALKITEECINCNACEPECPNNAIYENAASWSFAKGTSLTSIEMEDGTMLDARQLNAPISEKIFYIVPDKCTECKGFHEEPQCAAVCPVDCCVPDPEYQESEETLLTKKAWLHGEVTA